MDSQPAWNSRKCLRDTFQDEKQSRSTEIIIAQIVLRIQLLSRSREVETFRRQSQRNNSPIVNLRCNSFLSKPSCKQVKGNNIQILSCQSKHANQHNTLEADHELFCPSKILPSVLYGGERIITLGTHSQRTVRSKVADVADALCGHVRVPIVVPNGIQRDHFLRKGALTLSRNAKTNCGNRQALVNFNPNDGKLSSSHFIIGAGTLTRLLDRHRQANIPVLCRHQKRRSPTEEIKRK
jgi:hypothetical protein